MILIIDNYDSFSYNLVQQVGRVNPDLKVIRNDALSVDEIEALHPSHIILSPGPGLSLIHISTSRIPSGTTPCFR